MISFFVLLQVFSRTDEVRTIDIIYTFLFHLPFIVVVSINVFHSIPNLLNRYGIGIYLFMLFPLFGISLFLYQFSFGAFSRWVFPDYYVVGTFSLLEVTGITTFYILLSTLLVLSKSWFAQKETEVQLARLEENNTQNELKALRAQINPHFLFNSLNTIYGEALKKSDKTPGMILELSDILRYVVNHMDQDTVPLTEEIGYLEKFISIQKQRVSNPERIHFSVEGSTDNIEIPPLLLITFIENCFKHGSVSGANDETQIKITVDEYKLHLHTLNSLNTIEVIEDGINKASGTGIENALRRLNYLYPNRYDIDARSNEHQYLLDLNLKFS